MAANRFHVSIRVHLGGELVEIKETLSVGDDLLMGLVRDGVITFTEKEEIKVSHVH
jgi:hypothetical protein